VLSACKKSLIKVVYQDEDILLINKSCGLVTLKTSSYSGITLQDKIEKDFNIFAGGRGGLVHRLDKETSGLILAAKKETAFENLQKQFKNRTVKKVYWALAKGKVPQKGTVKVPIGRNPGNFLKLQAVPYGKKAETDFEVISYLKSYQKEFSLLRVLLKTGRTHQIRVHMVYLGHPLVGDNIYGSREDKDTPLFLVAKEIEFDHPASKKRLKFKIDLPEFFHKFIDDKEKTKTKKVYS